MNSDKSIRIIVDSAATGSWNMAVDQAILELVEQTGRPTLRIYTWEPATLSLGYFQSIEDRNEHIESLNCPVVRRDSGGGAILHDCEVTYSLIFPSQNRWSLQHTQLYRTIHDGLISVFNTWGLSLSRWETTAVDPRPLARLPFLCFQRRAIGDLIYDDHKIVGSAQRRNRNAVLQHGSILIRTSPFAPQLPGIEPLTGIAMDRHQFIERLIFTLAASLQLEPSEGQMTPKESALTFRLKREKFENSGWNHKR